jgi:hypothetical protein
MRKQARRGGQDFKIQGSDVWLARHFSVDGGDTTHLSLIYLFNA